MVIYITVLISIILVGYYFNFEDRYIRYDDNIIKFNTIGSSIIAVILVLVAGLRYYVGTDYHQYVINYTYLYKFYDFSFMLQPGNSIIGALVSCVYDDYSLWFFIMSFICIAPVIYVIQKYSINPYVCILFYVLLGCWSSSFNIIKQYAAVAMLLLFGYEYLIKKDFVKWAIACVIASVFHVTTVLLIPFYFLFNNNRSLVKNFILISFIGIGMYYSYDFAFSTVGFLKGSEMSYSDATKDYLVNSVNPLRIVIKFLPLALICVFNKRLDFNDEQFKVLVNISIVNAVLSLAAFNSIYMQRFMVYFGIFNAFLYPYLLQCFRDKEKVYGYPLIYLTYFVYWFYDLYKGSTTVDFHWIFERGF